MFKNHFRGKFSSACKIALGFSVLHSFAASADMVSAQFEIVKGKPELALIFFQDSENSGNNSPKRTAVIDQKNKNFTTKLLVLPPGEKLVFKNSDDIAHNIYADDSQLGVKFDLGIAEANSNYEKVSTVSWKDGLVVELRCKIHPTMRMWVASLLSAHYAIRDFSNSSETQVEILNLKPQSTQFTVWLPGFDPASGEVKPHSDITLPLKKRGKDAGTVKLIRK